MPRRSVKLLTPIGTFKRYIKISDASALVCAGKAEPLDDSDIGKGVILIPVAGSGGNLISRQGMVLRSLAVDRFSVVVGGFGSRTDGKHKLYGVLQGMIRRCTDPRVRSFRWYGRRGIKVCGEWMINADKFVTWALDNGYKEGLQIDRIDNDKGYCPDNCRFVTCLDNQQNKGPRAQESLFL